MDPDPSPPSSSPGSSPSTRVTPSDELRLNNTDSPYVFVNPELENPSLIIRLNGSDTSEGWDDVVWTSPGVILGGLGVLTLVGGIIYYLLFFGKGAGVKGVRKAMSVSEAIERSKKSSKLNKISNVSRKI